MPEPPRSAVGRVTAPRAQPHALRRDVVSTRADDTESFRSGAQGHSALRWRCLSVLVALVLALPAQGKLPGFKRCINMGNALDAPEEGEWGYVIGQDDLKMVRDAGFDAVRIPVRWSAHAAASAPYTIDAGFIDRVDQVTGWALALGLTTIIDIHHDSAFTGGSLAELGRLDALWAQIAAHYADAPDSLIFELINEPPGYFPAGFMDAANTRLVATIRRTNPTRRIIYGSDRLNSAATLIRSVPPADANVIATFHYYDPYDFTSQGMNDGEGGTFPLGQSWGTAADRRTLDDVFRKVADWAETNGQSVFLGEFGVNAKAPLEERVRWLTAVRGAAEARGFAWCNWAFRANFDAAAPDGTWIGPVLDALTGP